MKKRKNINDNETKKQISPGKRKLVRVIAELGVFLLGALVILTTKAVFDNVMNKKSAAGAALDLAKDDFNLFFMISLMICAVLLLLTLVSALTYMFQKNVSRFQRIVVSASPVICSAAVFAISLFYAYLTSGGIFGITAYIVSLGVGEAMLFRLPCAVYVLLRPADNTKKTK